MLGSKSLVAGLAIVMLDALPAHAADDIIDAVRRQVRAGREHCCRPAQWREGVGRERRKDGCADVERRDSRDRYRYPATREAGFGAALSLTTAGDQHRALR